MNIQQQSNEKLTYQTNQSSSQHPPTTQQQPTTTTPPTNKSTKRIKKSNSKPSSSSNNNKTSNLSLTSTNSSSSSSKKRPFDLISNSTHHEEHSFDQPSNYPFQKLSTSTKNLTPSNHHPQSQQQHHPQQQQHPNSHAHPNDPNPVSLTEDFPMIRCGWNDCRQGFWILEDLIDHLVGENGHVPPDPNAPRGQKCPCEWTGCPKLGKPQGSRMALMVHLRSHTGEKPFSCYKPECDKTFSRTDALAKHVRVSHGEILPSLRSMSNGKGTGQKKCKAEANDSSNEEDVGGGMTIEEYNQHQQANNNNNDQEVKKVKKELVDLINENGRCFNDPVDEDLRTEEDRKRLEELGFKYPSTDVTFLEFVVLKAKIKFALGEQEILKSELKLLEHKEQSIKSQKDAYLDELMRSQIGMESSSLWSSTIDQ